MSYKYLAKLIGSEHLTKKTGFEVVFRATTLCIKLLLLMIFIFLAKIIFYHN